MAGASMPSTADLLAELRLHASVVYGKDEPSMGIGPSGPTSAVRGAQKSRPIALVVA
jgi:hypothetical protein